MLCYGVCHIFEEGHVICAGSIPRFVVGYAIGTQQGSGGRSDGHSTQETDGVPWGCFYEGQIVVVGLARDIADKEIVRRAGFGIVVVARRWRLSRIGGAAPVFKCDVRDGLVSVEHRGA